MLSQTLLAASLSGYWADSSTMSSGIRPASLHMSFSSALSLDSVALGVADGTCSTVLSLLSSS